MRVFLPRRLCLNDIGKSIAEDVRSRDLRVMEESSLRRRVYCRLSHMFCALYNWSYGPYMVCAYTGLEAMVCALQHHAHAGVAVVRAFGHMPTVRTCGHISHMQVKCTNV